MEDTSGADALARALAGSLPPDSAVLTSPVRLRRLRMLQATVAGWRAMDEEHGRQIMAAMAAQFDDGRDHSREADHQGFYALLNHSDELEALFAREVALMWALGRAGDGSGPA